MMNEMLPQNPLQQKTSSENQRFASKDGGDRANRKTESRARLFWVAIILSFFGLQALLWTSALSWVKKHPHRPLQVEASGNDANIDGPNRVETASERSDGSGA